MFGVLLVSLRPVELASLILRNTPPWSELLDPALEKMAQSRGMTTWSPLLGSPLEKRYNTGHLQAVLTIAKSQLDRQKGALDRRICQGSCQARTLLEVPEPVSVIVYVYVCRFLLNMHDSATGIAKKLKASLQTQEPTACASITFGSHHPLFVLRC